MLLDGNFGMNKQDQTAAGSDFGTNYGTEIFGIPGTNGPDPRQSGMPAFRRTRRPEQAIGNTATWHPLERHETSYTVTPNLTKLAGRARVPRRVRLHPLPARSLAAGAGVGAARESSTSRATSTGTPGYTANAWNQYAAFLLGRTSGYGKSIQFEDDVGPRESVRRVRQRPLERCEKLTLNLGLRYEYYPLMTRSDRGIERLDFTTFNVLLGGVGNVPEDLGIKVSKNAVRAAPGRRLPAQREDGVPRRLRHHLQPDSVVAAAARVLSADDRLQPDATASNFASFPLADGIPPVPLPDPARARSAAAQRRDADARPGRCRARADAAVEPHGGARVADSTSL